MVRLKNIICEQLFKAVFELFFFTGVSNYCEERKKNALLKINFYIKISKNLGGNFSNLGSNCLDIWPFFRNFLAFQKASFQHFTSTIGTALSCQQWFLQAGRCATKEEKPLLATVCFSIEHARPRDITFSCFARKISKTATLHVLLNFLFISFRFYTTTT